MRFRKAARSSIQLGQHSIPISKLFEHVMISGNPGSGKSTLMRQFMRQVQDLGRPAIIIDIEGEATIEFYDESRGDVILNPLDARLEVIAPDEEPGAINAFLDLPRKKIHERLRGTRAYPLIDPDMKETGQTILSTAVNAVKPFQHLPRSDQATRRWSAREWSEHRTGWVFLPCRADSEAAIQGQQGVWLDSLVRWLLAAPIGSPSVYIFLDELPAMGFQPNVASLLTRGRKREIACTIGFQSISQLRSIYGHDGATTLTSCPTTQIFLRTPEPETARWASDSIGSHEVERIGISQLTGLSNYREGLTLNPHRAVEPLVLPGELQALEPFEGYISCGGARTTISIPRMHLVERNPDFIPRIPGTTVTAESIPEAEAQEPTDAEILAQVTGRAAGSLAQREE